MRRPDKLLPVLLVLPAIVYVAYFSFYPSADAVYLSFQTPHIPNTLLNYQEIGHLLLVPAIWNTVLVTAGALAIQFTAAMIIAHLLVGAFRGKSVFSTIAILPLGFSTVVAGVVMLYIFEPSGGYGNSILHAVGLAPYNWYQSDSSKLVMIMLADAWRNIPLLMLILLAGLTTIPESLYEAAAIDGAGPIRRFFYVTVPNLRSFIVIALMIRGVSEFNIFAIPQILTSNSPPLLTTLTFYLWGVSTTYQSLAAASILLAFILAFVAILIFLGGTRR
jgi:trehalose transport system permease protein